jgi:hypothetical protein
MAWFQVNGGLKVLLFPLFCIVRLLTPQLYKKGDESFCLVSNGPL